MPLSDVRCETPRCIQTIEKYGERYHGVRTLYLPAPSFLPDAIVICEWCGGYFNGEKWVHQCIKCNKSVEPGELVGLFVPHLCKECEQAIVDEDIRQGNICTLCRTPRSRCCC